MGKRLKPAIDLLRAGSRHGDDAFDDVLRHARALQHLDKALRRRLPQELADHVHVANARDKRLVMIADSAAWATRLRFHRGDVLRGLRSPEGLEITRLDIQVRPRGKEPRAQRRPQPPSAAACRDMEAAASHIGDEELADALRRLARIRPQKRA